MPKAVRSDRENLEADLKLQHAPLGKVAVLTRITCAMCELSNKYENPHLDYFIPLPPVDGFDVLLMSVTVFISWIYHYLHVHILTKSIAFWS